jgi:RNA polymerase sigma factor (sigma-70 family)
LEWVRYAPRDGPDATSDFEPWELQLVRSLVFDFLAERALPRDVEFDDIAQECLQHWWSQRDRYDARHGASRMTFLRKVVRGRLHDLARGWRAEKRGSGQQPLSLDAPASRDDPTGPTIREALRDRRDLGSDVSAAVDWSRLNAKLSDRQKQIIDGVTAGMTKTDLSRQLQISRDTLHRELKRIRQTFQDEGLAEYLR